MSESELQDNESWESSSAGDFVEFSEDERVPFLCLFCKSAGGDSDITGLDVLTGHMKSAHGFDLRAFRRKHQLEFHQTICLINYIRQSGVNACELTNKSIDIPAIVNDEQYLVPAIENDRLLYEFSDNEDESEDDGPPAINNNDYCELKAKYDNLLQLVKNMTMDDDDHEKKREPQEQTEEKLDYYFNSYSHVEIHEDMLKDRVRTEAYRDFIYGNKDLFKDKIVLDVGCGTGILSMFASRAGAKQVYAVDNSRMIEMARQIARQNNIENITFFQGKMEQVQLPSKVDIIISEWMGYFLLYEGMLDSVIYARDKWLKPECKHNVFPNVTTIQLAAVEDEEWHMDRFHFWKQVYGFDMSCIPSKYYKEQCIVDLLSSNDQQQQQQQVLISHPVCVKHIDCTTTTVSQLDFTQHFQLESTRPGSIYSICVWFDVEFGDTVHFSTGPLAKPTHWKQSILPLDDPIVVDEAGEVVNGEIGVVKAKDNPRDLEICLKIAGRQYKYRLAS